jgi:acylphosphatase
MARRPDDNRKRRRSERRTGAERPAPVAALRQRRLQAAVATPCPLPVASICRNRTSLKTVGSVSADRRIVRVRIEGRVQGVGFRFWTVEQAEALGLDGWVRNRRDGSVEAVFAGAPARVDEMIRRCRRGPPAARVDRIGVESCDEEVPPGFCTLPTV